VIVPRPYQDEARRAVWRELSRVQSTLAVLPTGCGKTVLFSHLASDWLERFPERGRVLVLAHRKELLDQAKRKLEAVARVPVGIDRAEERANPGDRGLFPTRVVAGCVPTLVKEARRRRYDPDWPWLVVVDECHHVEVTEDGRGGNSYATVLRHFTGNPESKVLGVTATPHRTDGVALGNAFQSLAYHMGLRDAIDGGWLVDGAFLKPVVEGLDFSGVRTVAGELDREQVAEIATRERPLQEVAFFLHREAGSKKVIVFCANRAHVKAMHEVLSRPAYFGPQRVASADGETPPDVRAEVVARFARGQVQVLVNCNLLTEGFDCPDAEVLAFCRPSKSKIVVTQAVGRVLRPLEGVVDGPATAEARRAAIAASAKPRALLIDFTGRTLKRQAAVDPVDVLQGHRTESEREAIRRAASRSKSPVDFDAVAHRLALEEALRREQEEWERRAAVAATGGSYRVEQAGTLSGSAPSQSDSGPAPSAAAPPAEAAVPPSQRPTRKQINTLVWLGVSERAASAYTRAQASAVITKELKRQGKSLRRAEGDEV